MQAAASTALSCTSEARKQAIAVWRLGASSQLMRPVEEVAAARQGADQIDASGTKPGRQRRSDHQGQGADPHDPRRALVADHDRQHGHARFRVVGPVGDRQAPEMRRRPEEQDQREQPGQRTKARIRGGRACKRGKTAGEPADRRCSASCGASARPCRPPHRRTRRGTRTSPPADSPTPRRSRPRRPASRRTAPAMPDDAATRR